MLQATPCICGSVECAGRMSEAPAIEKSPTADEPPRSSLLPSLQQGRELVVRSAQSRFDPPSESSKLGRISRRARAQVTEQIQSRIVQPGHEVLVVEPAHHVAIV